MKVRCIVAAVLAAALVAVPGASAAKGGKSITALVDAHIAALRACDADALVAGYTADAKLFFPDGTVVQGRSALQELYDGFVKPPAEGGLCGLDARPVDRFTRGRTTFVKFEVTAPFLAEPYFSTDAYVFKGRKIVSEVSTFDSTKLKFIP
jgi:hypothetical protein